MWKIFKTDTNIQKNSHDNALIIAVLFWAVVFIGFFVFFTVVHPLYIFDTDDWTNIRPQRSAIPIWRDWNPTKVLPETLMPLAAELGVRLFMPISRDYIGSIAIAFALVVSAFYSTYFLLFYYFSTKKFKIPAYLSIMLGTFMLLLHFLPFVKASSGNAYMYAPPNVTCVFHYTIPALLNASLILLFSSGSCVEKADVGQILRAPKLRYGIWLLVIYLAINSNILNSIIFIAYISSVLMIEYVKGGVRLFLDVCRKNIIWIGVIYIWLLSLIMESRGGRASSIQFSGSYWSAVGKTIKALINTIKELNLLFISIFIIIEAIALILFLLSRNVKTDSDEEYIRWTIIYSVSLLITVVYLVLICTRTGTGYLIRSDVFSGILFFVMMLVWISLIYIIKKSKPVIFILPLVIYILLFETVFNVESYKETNFPNYKEAVVEEISNDILDQVLMADWQGKTTMELYVPVYTSKDNFPIATYGGREISRTLFAQGMINRQIEITIVPTYDMNEKYDLQ